jgi:hypothetical protein
MTMQNYLEIKSSGIKFDFSGPKIPQGNGKVERNSRHFMEESGQCLMEMICKVN